MNNKFFGSKLNTILLLVLIILIAGILFLMFKNKEIYLPLLVKNQNPVTNNEVLNEVSLNDLDKVVKEKLPNWYNPWAEKIPGFSFSMFEKRYENSITAEEYPYDFEANKLRESIYVYSPDKTKIIDPKGGMGLFEKDGKIMEAYDVDSSVKLIDIKSKIWKQVASCGTPCGFQGATWVDNNSFIVVGSYHGLTKEECVSYEKCMYPTIAIYDLVKNNVVSYKVPEVNFELNTEISKNNNPETYTYRNHGFTIELPKGFVPSDKLAENGPAWIISLPTGGLTFVTDVVFWEKSTIPSYTYIKDEKIGETTFKLYTYLGGYYYWYKRGNVGYEFGGTNKNEIEDLINTFKFVGWPQIEGNKEDLVLFSIKPGQEVSGKMTVTGSIKGAYFFEGSFPVYVLDVNKKRVPYGTYGAGYAKATSEWMTGEPVSFTIDIDFGNLSKGQAYIELKQDDPSGGESGRPIKSILIPIIIN